MPELGEEADISFLRHEDHAALHGLRPAEKRINAQVTNHRQKCET
jgi:hypothetical protein